MQKANDYKKRKGLGTDAVAKAKPSSVKNHLLHKILVTVFA
jgi:hypothetical protein